jgi:hypothetical protein
MTRQARCEAKGGVHFCRSARCPERGELAWAIINGALSESNWSDQSVAGLTQLMRDLTEQHGFPEVGRTRAVFDLGDGWVVKIPLNDEGVGASSSEEYAYQRGLANGDPWIPVARCEFRQLGERYYLHMERVEPLVFKSYDDVPQWVGYVDGGQVGHTADGRLVAYDL